MVVIKAPLWLLNRLGQGSRLTGWGIWPENPEKCIGVGGLGKELGWCFQGVLGSPEKGKGSPEKERDLSDPLRGNRDLMGSTGGF